MSKNKVLVKYKNWLTLVLLILFFLLMGFLFLKLDYDYQKSYLDNFAYPLLVLGVSALGGIAFYEKFKKDLEMSYFRNSSIFVKRLDKAETLYKKIVELIDIINKIIDLLKHNNPNVNDTLNNFLKILDEIIDLTNNNELYESGPIYDSLREINLQIKLGGDLLYSLFSNPNNYPDLTTQDLANDFEYINHKLYIYKSNLASEIRENLRIDK